jgi:hypothetical protein
MSSPGVSPLKQAKLSSYVVGEGRFGRLEGVTGWDTERPFKNNYVTIYIVTFNINLNINRYIELYRGSPDLD